MVGRVQPGLVRSCPVVASRWSGSGSATRLQLPRRKWPAISGRRRRGQRARAAPGELSATSATVASTKAAILAATCILGLVHWSIPRQDKTPTQTAMGDSDRKERLKALREAKERKDAQEQAKRRREDGDDEDGGEEEQR